MRGVLGGSLIAVASLAASQTFAEKLQLATASHHEAWQIVAEAQLARVIFVDPILTFREPSPIEFSSTVSEQIQAEKPQAEKMPAVQLAAIKTPVVEGAVSTASLADAPADIVPVLLSAPAVIRPPMPRIRPLNAPRPPAANSREDICNTLAESAQKHNLPLAFFGNLIYQESGLKPRVVSHVGARGIAQFMPGTARMVGLKNPFNPREALPASAKFLRSLLRTFDNNYGLAAAAYNAGPGKVSRWLKRRTVLPKETRDYVMTITGQRAEHWRGIRGNKFGHRLARRMPCNGMVQFAYANEETITEKGVVHAVFMTLPRPHPLRAAGQFASALPMAVSFTSTANAAPAPIAAEAVASTPVQKDEARPDNVAAPVAPAMAVVASATESVALPRVAPATNEPATGSVTTVKKSEPAPAPKHEKIAAVQPNEKATSSAAAFVAPLPRANPLREAKLSSGKNTEKHADKSDKKLDKKNDKKADRHADAKKKRRG